MEWVLVVFFTTFNGGGPTTVYFPTEIACKTAMTTLKEQFGSRVERIICFSRLTGNVK